jgi:hypothetical protein
MDKQSRVKSQITDKVYEVSLDDLDEEDDAFESELYRINVFGKNVIIAPGKPIKDQRIQGLVYFYVYVIKNGKAIAKLGVYEMTTSNSKEIYDLTTFPDGALLMFDLYYNKPLLITEFEEVENTNKVNVEGVNIFDYLNEYVVPETNVVSKIKEQNRKITTLKINIGKNYKETPNLIDEYKELLNIFKDHVIDKALLKSLKTTNPKNFMFVLYVLEFFLNVRFIYIDTDNKIISDDEYKKKIKMPSTISSNIVVVRLGKMAALVKVYEPDTPREIIEEEITELEISNDLTPQIEEEPVDEEPVDEANVKEANVKETPINKGLLSKAQIGTSLNFKPEVEPFQYEPHSPEGPVPNELKIVPSKLKPVTSEVKPFQYEPHSPEGPGPTVINPDYSQDPFNETPKPVNLNNSSNSNNNLTPKEVNLNSSNTNSSNNLTPKEVNLNSSNNNSSNNNSSKTSSGLNLNNTNNESNESSNKTKLPPFNMAGGKLKMKLKK